MDDPLNFSSFSQESVNRVSFVFIAVVVFVFVGIAFIGHPPNSSNPQKPGPRRVERIEFHTDPRMVGVQDVYSRGSGDFRARRDFGQPEYESENDGFCEPRFDYLSFTV